MSTADELRAAREESGIGLRQLARWANVDPTHLSRFEHGRATMPLPSVLRIAAALGIDRLTVTLDVAKVPVLPDEYDREAA